MRWVVLPLIYWCRLVIDPNQKKYGGLGAARQLNRKTLPLISQLARCYLSVEPLALTVQTLSYIIEHFSFDLYEEAALSGDSLYIASGET